MQVNTPITSTVFKDSHFSVDSWRVESYYADNGACIVVDQIVNPCSGTYRQHTHQWWKVSEDPSTMLVGHIPKDVTYRPSEKGSIQSIDFSCNISNIENAADVQIGLLLIQHNNIYTSKRTFSSLVPSWCYFSMENMKAGDFKRLDSTFFDVPNFSIVGGEIQLGYFTIRTTNQPQFVSISGIDTWRVTVTHEDQDAIHQQIKVLQLEHNMTFLQQELSQRLSKRSSPEDVTTLEAELTQARCNYNQALAALESQASVIQQQKEALLGAEDKAMSLTQELKLNTAAMLAENDLLRKQLQASSEDVLTLSTIQAENQLLRQQLKASSEEVFSLKETSEMFAAISKEKQELEQELYEEREKHKADSELLQSFLNIREAMGHVESQLAIEHSRRVAVEQELIKQKMDGERKERIYQDEVDANERDTKSEIEHFKLSCQHELDSKITEANEQLTQYRDLVSSQEEEIQRLVASNKESYHVRLSFRETIEHQANHIHDLQCTIEKLQQENALLARSRRQTPQMDEEEDGFVMASSQMKDDEDEWEVVQGM